MSSTNFGNSVIDAVLPVFAGLYQQKVNSGNFTPPSCAEEFIAMFKGEEVLHMENARKEIPTGPCCVKVCAVDLKKSLKGFTFQKDGAKRKTQMEMPFLPSCVDYSKTCQALQNGGSLYSPCLTRVTGSEPICKSCKNAGIKYGTIQDRNSVEADTKYKRKKINYGTWCAKRGIPQEYVKEWLSDNFPAIVIPDEEWIVKKKVPRGPRKSGKSVSTSSDEDSVSVETDVSAPAVEVEEEASVETVVAPAAEVEAYWSNATEVVTTDDETSSVESMTSSSTTESSTNVPQNKDDIIKKKKKIEKSAIFEIYIERTLLEEKMPKSVFLFCKHAKIQESEFYLHFGSLDSVRSAIFEAFYKNATQVQTKH